MKYILFSLLCACGLPPTDFLDADINRFAASVDAGTDDVAAGITPPLDAGVSVVDAGVPDAGDSIPFGMVRVTLKYTTSTHAYADECVAERTYPCAATQLLTGRQWAQLQRDLAYCEKTGVGVEYTLDCVLHSDGNQQWGIPCSGRVKECMTPDFVIGYYDDWECGDGVNEKTKTLPATCGWAP